MSIGKRVREYVHYYFHEYAKRLKYINTFHIFRGLDEIVRKPDFFSASLQLLIGSVIFSTLFQLANATVIHVYLQTITFLGFMTFWLFPALTSYAILRLLRKKFDTQAYMEATSYATFPLGTAINIYFVSSLIYHNLLVHDYPAYAAYGRMGEWWILQWAAIIGGLVTLFLFVVVMMRVAKVKWYWALPITLVSMVSLFGTYEYFVFFTS
jgi:hypothetical protein